MQDPRPLIDAALGHALGIHGAPYEVTTLKGDASSRSYHRVAIPGNDPPTAVIMELAADPLSSDEFTDWIPPEYPFTLVHRFLSEGGLPVPRIYGARPGEGWLVLEDLGDETMEKVLGTLPESRWEPWYARAMDLLVRWHGWWNASRTRNPVAGRVFSRRLLAWELDHYVEWGLEERLGTRLAERDREELTAAFQPLLDELERIPTCLVHRDFQSRNLMIRPGETDLVIIDFQDALMGPVIYDAVALLCDSYLAVPPRLQDSMLERLRTSLDPGGDADAWRRWFDLQCVQRKLKDAGRFVFIDRVKSNPDFLPYVGQSLAYARRALERLPELGRLRGLLESHGGLDEN